MEALDKVDQSLERAGRILELSNFETIAQTERGRLIARLKERRLPKFFCRYEGETTLKFSGFWEVLKFLLLVGACLLSSPHWPLFVSIVLAFLASLVIQTLVLKASVAWVRRRPGIEWLIRILILPSRFLLPGRFLAEVIAQDVVGLALEWRGLGKPLYVAEYDKELKKVEAMTAAELVRGYAVAEIEGISTDIVGPKSMLVESEKVLQQGFYDAKDLREQIWQRLQQSEGARRQTLEQGMKDVSLRLTNMRKALNKHQELMARVREILHECMASAQGLSEAVTDAELLAKLEAGMAEDERRIALSELVMEQAVDQLRGRVMSVQAVMAQLKAPQRVRVAEGSQTVDEPLAYIEHVEEMAVRLAAI